MAVSIQYSALEEAIKYFGKAEGNCSKYKKAAEEVIKTLEKMPEGEDCGYIDGILDKVKDKVNSAKDMEGRCKKIADKIANFTEYVKNQDKNAANSINTTITSAVGERSFFQKLGDYIYEGYVNFLDKIESMGPVGKLIAQGLRKAGDWIGEAMTKAYNWFKYGNGKYILNMLSAAKDVILAVCLVVAAVAVAVFTGPVWLVALSIVAIVAASIFLICQIADSKKKIDANTKAFSLGEDGNITAARYYGEISGISSDIAHHDYGGEEDNAKMESLGKTFDTVKTVSQVTASISTAVVSFASLGLTQTADGKTVVDLKRAFQGYKAKVLHSAGFNSNDYQTGGFDANKALNPMDKFFSTKNSSTFDTLMGKDRSTASKVISYTLDLTKWASNTEKVVSGVNTLANGGTSGFETVKTVMDVAGFVPFVDAFTGDAWKVIDGGSKIISNVITPQDTTVNPYIQQITHTVLPTTASPGAAVQKIASAISFERAGRAFENIANKIPRPMGAGA